MDFLKHLALSQGIEHYHLLVFIAALCSVVFIPYILFVLGSSVVSLWFNLRSGAPESRAIARTVIADALPTKSSMVFLGVLPGLSLVLIYAQMLQSTPAISVGLAGGGFIFLVIGLSLLFSYRHLSGLQGIFNAYETLLGKAGKLEEPARMETETTLQPMLRFGTYGTASLFVAVFLYLASWSLLSDPHGWESVQSFLDVLLTPSVWLKLLLFLAIGIGATGAGILYFHQSRTSDAPAISAGLLQVARRFIVTAFLAIPLLVFAILAAIPVPALSGVSFFLAGLALLFFFVSAHCIYQNFKQRRLSMLTVGALFFLLASQLIVVSDHVGISAATRTQARFLAIEDDMVLSDLKQQLGVAAPAMTGQEIYEAKCNACHMFDKKKVGPAYNTVLPKYIGKKAQMMSFVLNPIKVNPEFQAMPNQGLKPSEADSVVTYLLDMMEKMSKKK